jgi:hypothetical protein
MVFSPIANTKNVDDADRYVGLIPPLGANGSGTFSIYVKDTQNQFQIYPRKAAINISASTPVVNDVVINEFLADNVNSFPDPNGEHDDWVELYNPSASPVLLTGRYMTDNPANLIKWRFTQPSLYLYPGEYLVVWCDDDLSQPGIHTNFKLSKSGEYIALVDTNGVSILDSLSFGLQKTDTSYGRFPNGTATWLFMNPTPGSSNIVTSISNETLIPNEFKLEQNYPNPFNPSTTISWQSPVGSHQTIKVFDILGNEITTLVDEYKPAGSYETEFTATERLASGVYFYKLTASNFVQTKKMILMR